MTTVSVDQNGIPTDLGLKLVTASAETSNGIAILNLQIPSGGRFIQGGKMWFCGTPHRDDMVKIEVLAIVGEVETVMNSYADMGVPVANRGARIPIRTGEVDSRNITNLKYLPEGLWLRVTGVTGDLRADTFCANLLWGARG